MDTASETEDEVDSTERDTASLTSSSESSGMNETVTVYHKRKMFKKVLLTGSH